LTVRVVDELGEAIEGLPLSFVADGEEHSATTDDTGTGRVEASSADATVTLGAPATLLEAVGDRWAHVREGDWLEEQPDHIFVDVAAPSVVVPIDAARTVTIVVQPRTVLARIKGMLFDTDRCFLLPSALEHLPRLTALYADHENSALLVVGHTDTTGDDAYNDTLSLERAQAVAAFLRDDPAVWVQRYDTNLDARKRWGAHEDNLMLQALFERSGEAVEGSPMVHFQRSRGLEANGVASPQTREALITEYMALDGTTLPAGVEMGVYGCGERFPVGEDGTTVDTDAPDGHEDQLDRRVELLFFPAGLGVLPAPAGELCKDGERVYEEWRRRAAETHEFDAVSHLHAIVLDDPIFGVAAGISVEATYASGLQQTATTDADGRLKLEPRGGDFVDLRYTFSGQEVTKRVFTAVDDVASPEGAWQRLVHLGYVPLPQPERQPPDPEALEDALLLFQLDYSLEPTATQDDETVATLLRAHDQDLRPWKDRDWEIPDEPEPHVEKPKEEVS
jgi:outer membrane protein OmpA-like peptidoglycan-associated protein